MDKLELHNYNHEGTILTVVWTHSGAILLVGEIQFIAGIGVTLFLMCSGYNLEISFEKNS